uniref:RNA-directed RNA polymerase n=1 Tax=Nigrospora sphaerica victorivirus 1 TaxID=2851965 RepID=A0A915V7P3_9VIRU|nr:RNA dependent RNA polymerase [Nigrospora sphaerica victorivirus 1]
MSLQSRSEAYALLGERLLATLSAFPDIVKAYSGIDFTRKLIRLSGDTDKLQRVHPLLPACVSLLLVDYPMQLNSDYASVLRIVRHSFDFSFLNTNATDAWTWHDSLKGLTGSRLHRALGRLAANDKAFRTAVFPKKAHAAAGVKVNIKLGPLARAWATMYSLGDLGKALLACGPMYNDRVCSFLLLAQTYRARFGAEGMEWAAAMVRQPKNAGGLSNALKSLGANTTEPGNFFVEGKVLQGRYDLSIDMDAEVEKRVVQEAVDEQVIPLTPQLRQAIKYILDIELGANTVALPDMDDWWTSRWLWCVNGAENALSDGALGLPRGRDGQRYRRMASEEVVANPVPDWDCKTLVSASVKLECGKDRAIFACDTLSYFAFTYLLNPIQDAWRGERVILDPGRGGHYGIAKRIRGCQRGGGVNLMLDYDDFNSHHSTEVMQALFEETLNHTDAPTWYREKILKSLDNVFISYGGRLRHVKGTLMSGHRGTTFVNSVLNAAYVCAAIGIPAFRALISLHAGDDVYMRVNTLGSCDSVLTATRNFGCRMNPTKQSIGFVGAEFLRIGIGPTYAVGYLCRSIATLVAGNWTTLEAMDPLNSLTSAISTTRSCMNRGAVPQITTLLAGSYAGLYGYRKQALAELLSGRAVLGKGPVYNTGHYLIEYTVREEKPPDKDIPHGTGMYATLAYLANHVSPVERTAIDMVQPALVSMMLESSFGKARTTKSSQRPARPVLVRSRPRVANGFAIASELWNVATRRGVLTSSPLIRLFEKRLNDSQLRELVTLAGGDGNARDIRTEAFGAEGSSANIMGYLPYSDASQYCKRTTAGNILVPYNIRT